jgi:membrane-associated protease RseP (regulator of RpoE activity)
MRPDNPARRALWLCLAMAWLSLAASISAASQDGTALFVESVSVDSMGLKVGFQVGDRIISYDGKILASPWALTTRARSPFVNVCRRTRLRSRWCSIILASSQRVAAT